MSTASIQPLNVVLTLMFVMRAATRRTRRHCCQYSHQRPYADKIAPFFKRATTRAVLFRRLRLVVDHSFHASNAETTPARSIRITALRRPRLRPLLSTVHSCQLRRALCTSICVSFSNIRSTIPFDRIDQATHSNHALKAPATMPCCIRPTTLPATYRIRFKSDTCLFQASKADDVFA